jgi:hypothetical protein
VTDFEQSKPEILCVREGTISYGGISFYDGEGMNGRGGLLRKDASGKVELRRPAELTGRSVSALAVRDGVVWFGTTRHEECMGDLFEHGLVRYEWSTRKASTFEGSDDGPLGFVIKDLLFDDDVLWVATDLGISRLQLETKTWRHWIATERGSRWAMEETTPDALHRRLLQSVPRDALMTDAYENQLIEALARFRPRFLQHYLAQQPAQKWDCPAARFLGQRMTSFAQFEKRVARHIDGPTRVCAMEGFALTRNHEEAWRDYLLQADAGEPGAARTKRGGPRLPAAVFREFRGDAAVERHLLQRLDDETLTVLPLVMGSRSIAVLRKELDRPTRHNQVREQIIYALELATHRRITADGSVETLPEGSDRPWYADLVTLDDFEQRWDTLTREQRELVVQRWREAIDQKRFAP